MLPCGPLSSRLLLSLRRALTSTSAARPRPPRKPPAEHLRHPAFLDLEHSLSSGGGLPAFQTRGEKHVKVLYQPRQFYRTLLEKIRGAKRRIFLASLYVGKEEVELIQTLHTALRSNPSLRLTLLVDYLRSTREHPHPSSASLLASLAASFPSQVDLRLFHTPNLSGWERKWVPKRFNEGWGLMHMKVYGVDDEVILSGANLSHDYFTNRTDRYLLFSAHAPLADYFSSLLSLISRFSYRVTARDTSTPHPAIDISWPREGGGGGGGNALPEDPFEAGGGEGGVGEMKQRGKEEIEALTRLWARKGPRELSSSLPPFASSSSSAAAPFTSSSPASSWFDTSLRPVLQMAPFSITQETSLVVPEIFRAANALATAPGGRNTVLDWTSGYFGLKEGGEYERLVLECRAGVRIVSASPEANGFHLSRGVSRFIPPAYTYFAQRFYERVIAEAERRAKRRGESARGEDAERHVEMREWRREGWTYHAKGIWLAPSVSNPYSPPAADPATTFSSSPLYLPDPHSQDFALRHSHPSPPFLTLLGSSNYGSRSATRDLEAGLLLTTHSDRTRWELEKEVRAIREYATEVVERRMFERPEREVPLGVRVAARAIEGML
ncbi:hypothetical protein JCM10213_007472 [Rhodosporidiobolus nylandii]